MNRRTVNYYIIMDSLTITVSRLRDYAFIVMLIFIGFMSAIYSFIFIFKAGYMEFISILTHGETHMMEVLPVMIMIKIKVTKPTMTLIVSKPILTSSKAFASNLSFT